MTKAVQNKVLHHLNFLKSLDYEYHTDIEINNKTSDEINLPDDIIKLQTITQNCHLCQLSKYRANVLFGHGNVNAKIMFIGDEPTISEDEVGEFFVGKSGSMLANMIENVININKNEVYITNIVKCRSSHNKISQEEANCCKAYLKKQISLINPSLIVVLGEVAYDFLIENKLPFLQTRGQILNKDDYSVMPTYHPNYLLRNPSLKKEAYYDMLRIKSFLEKQ